MCKSFLSQKPTAHVLLTEKIIEEFGLKVLKSVIPVVCNILVQITQTEIDLNTTSDACFRSCLALIRSVILFRKECSKQKSMIKEIPVPDGLTNKENRQPGSNESMYGGIDDDYLLNINLEDLSNYKSHIQSQ